MNSEQPRTKPANGRGVATEMLETTWGNDLTNSVGDRKGESQHGGGSNPTKKKKKEKKTHQNTNHVADRT